MFAAKLTGSSASSPTEHTTHELIVQVVCSPWVKMLSYRASCWGVLRGWVSDCSAGRFRVTLTLFAATREHTFLVSALSSSSFVCTSPSFTPDRCRSFSDSKYCNFASVSAAGSYTFFREPRFNTSTSDSDDFSLDFRSLTCGQS